MKLILNALFLSINIVFFALSIRRLIGNIVLSLFHKYWVCRSGTTLTASFAYSIFGSTFTLTPNTTVLIYWAIYANDVIEVQFII